MQKNERELTREDLLADWGEVVRILGHVPTGQEYSGVGKYPWKRLKERFKWWFLVPGAFRRYAQGKSEWEDVLRLLPERNRAKRIRRTNAELLADWGELARKLGRLPSRQDYAKEGLSTRTTLRKRFGSWHKMPAVFENFSKEKPEWADVLAILETPQASEKSRRGDKAKGRPLTMDP